MKDHYSLDIKEAIKSRVHNILEQANIEKATGGTEALSLLVQEVSPGNDGSNICDLDKADQLSLAEEFIESSGIEKFLEMVKSTGLSSAIYNAASEQLDADAADFSLTVVEKLDSEFKRDSGVKSKDYKKVSLSLGLSSHLDYFPPARIKDGVEWYRNIEEKGNDFDLYRYKIEGVDFVIVCAYKN